MTPKKKKEIHQKLVLNPKKIEFFFEFFIQSVIVSITLAKSFLRDPAIPAVLEGIGNSRSSNALKPFFNARKMGSNMVRAQ